MPTEHHLKTVCSLTALICVVVNIVCCLLYLLQMNHYAVMMFISATSANMKDILLFECFLNVLYLSIYLFHFCTFKSTSIL